jgi:hypothetical protein
MENMIAGALASSVSTLVLYPWEKVKIEMQTDKHGESLSQIILRIY